MRNTHPNHWKYYLIFAVGSIAAGLNLIIFRPAFMPFDLPKVLVGIIFLSSGSYKLALLMLNWSNTRLRLSMALTLVIFAFWAGILTFEFFRLSQTSLQLPIFVLMLAAIGYVTLIEPSTNPATDKTEKENNDV